MLFDTLLEESERLKLRTEEEKEETKEKESKEEKKKTGCTSAEIVAVLGHELGHWSMNHVLKNILIAQVGRQTMMEILMLIIMKMIKIIMMKLITIIIIRSRILAVF